MNTAPSQPQTAKAPQPTLHNAPSLERPLHLAVGMFDGVHIGHQAVIGAALAAARADGGIGAVLSFTPHPSRLFRPQSPTRLLMPVATKVSVLEQLGVGLTLIHPFDHEFAAIEADAFVPFLKRCLPTLRAIYVGTNFRYGKARRGDAASLAQSCRTFGIGMTGVERVLLEGQSVSSTRIRSGLEAGDLGEVNRLLGYRYFASGQTVSGQQLGRKLGFPTLNLPWEPELAPPYGVYAVRVRRSNGSDEMDAAPAGLPWQNAVANYGIRPTVARLRDVAPLLEVHTLAPTNITTGERICVQWLHHLRAEKKFDSIDQLQEQIAADAQAARAILDR